MFIVDTCQFHTVCKRETKQKNQQEKKCNHYFEKNKNIIVYSKKKVFKTCFNQKKSDDCFIITSTFTHSESNELEIVHEI